MVYSTCSFSYEEDEEVIEHLLKNTDASLKEIEKSPLYFVSHKGYGVHLLPSIFPGEGHYIALINKPGELQKKNKVDYYQKEEKFGDYLFTISEPFPTKHLNVIRYGIKKGQIDKNGLRYDYHCARFIKDFPNVLEIDFTQLQKYYLGETLNIVVPKGYVLLRYQGINVDIAKSDGRMIKNHLPKGLRKKILF